MQVVIFEAEAWERQVFRAALAAHEVKFIDGPIDARTVLPETEVLSVFVNSTLDSAALASTPKLRFIAARSTGVDHIDLKACASRKILVSNVPSYGEATVAEHAFGLLLSVVRHIAEASLRTRSGDFSQAGLRGFELRGKVLGVIGTGRIGRHVIAIARGFGMEVLAHDIAPDEAAARNHGFRYVDLPVLLAESDVVSLHVPATRQTQGLVSDAEFARMKPGAVLINTARGGVVDPAALVRALKAGKLSAAGLDVLPQEPALRDEAEIFRLSGPLPADLQALVADHVLLGMPNVIVTPHIAYNTIEAVRRIVEVSADNIAAFAKGTPQNLVGG